MDTIDNRHYDGFEGEPEIQFIRVAENGDKFILRIWIGFFDSIMSAIKPKTYGWTGLSYYYHMHEGWYTESPWRAPDTVAIINELKKLNKSMLDSKTQNVLNDIIELLLDSQQGDDKIWICYD